MNCQNKCCAKKISCLALFGTADFHLLVQQVLSRCCRHTWSGNARSILGPQALKFRHLSLITILEQPALLESSLKFYILGHTRVRKGRGHSSTATILRPTRAIVVERALIIFTLGVVHNCIVWVKEGSACSLRA